MITLLAIGVVIVLLFLVLTMFERMSDRWRK
jgi:hypothetical protein